MIIKAPISSEKAIRLMEAENKLVFVVDGKATKQDIKSELESLFKVKVTNVNTHRGSDAKKRAIVTFAADTPAIDLATKLELM